MKKIGVVLNPGTAVVMTIVDECICWSCRHLDWQELERLISENPERRFFLSACKSSGVVTGSTVACANFEALEEEGVVK